MKKNNEDLSVIKYKLFKGIAGFGLKATDSIEKGELIIEYIGPRIHNRDLPDKPNQYLMEVSKTMNIDGSPRDNTARYINHSCRPNAELEIKKGRALIRAIKKINPGEEIFYDYGKDFFDTYIKPKGCRCIKCVSKKEKSNTN